MIKRQLFEPLLQDLAEYPAVALLGPRQAGKTTLALDVAGRLGGVYLDLESEQDRAKLAAAELYLGERLDRLVVLDEVHRAPDLFPVLRGLIDRARRAGRRSGCYLLLGSASLDLLKPASESLAGRIAYRELTPFTAAEIPGKELSRLWLRGGFPTATWRGARLPVCAGARISSAAMWNGKCRYSRTGSAPSRCAACGAWSRTRRAACSMPPCWPAVWASTCAP
ncbi:MAG: AAA family ATPase [Burkholderiales bacterium]